MHVDDFIAAAPTDGEVEQIFQQVKGQFEVKDMGEPSRFLGSAILPERRVVPVPLCERRGLGRAVGARRRQSSMLGEICQHASHGRTPIQNSTRDKQYYMEAQLK